VRVNNSRIDDDIARASSRWLEPAAIERLVSLHLERVLDAGRSPLLGSGPAKTLRLSSEARRRLIPPRTRGARPSAADREWDAWLKGDQATLSLTFDRETANADRSLAFVTPVHPLVQSAARAVGSDEQVRVGLVVESSTLPPGEHPFAMYQWTLSGLKEDSMLVPVVADEDVRRDFAEVLSTARDDHGAVLPAASVFDALDGWHHELWEERRARHVADTQELARFRRGSLEVSFRARMEILEEQRSRAGEDRIRRMRVGQIDRALADHREALLRIARDEARADVLARRVAVGLLRVESGR
jgi:ATP-dependent helicase HepA